MTDESNDDGWRYSLDEVGPDTSDWDDPRDSEESETEESGGSVFDAPSNPIKGQHVVLLPLWACALYAFTAYQATLSGLTAMFGGATGLAKVVASAFALVGATTAAAFALGGVLAVVLLLVGLYKRDVARIVVSLLVFGVGAALWFITGQLFSHLPVLMVMGVGVPIVGMYLSLVTLVLGSVFAIGSLMFLAGAVLL